jgi:hypothetical protein
MSRGIHGLLLAAAAWFLVSAIAVAQCPMCKTSVEKSPEGQGLASKLNLAILVLFGAPFAAAGVIGFLLWRAHRRRSKSRPAALDAGANI